MKKIKHKTYSLIWISYVAVSLISAIALIFSIAAINGKNLEFDYNNTIGFAGIVFAVAGVVFTIFFVVFGYRTVEIYKRLSDAEDITEDVNNDMRNNLKETTNLISSIKGLKSDSDKNKYLTLAEGRLLCSSRFSTDEEKETGIGYLQQYSDKQSDVELLEAVMEAALKEKKTKIKNAAKRAIKEIEKRIK